MLFGGPGFAVSDISHATAGVIGTPIAFEVGLPAVRTGQDIKTHLTRIHGVDLRFHTDFFLKANGDLQLTSGLEAFRNNLARSLVTPKGALHWRPDYGIGLVEFLNMKASAANVYEMQNRIHLNLRAEKSVEKISRNEVRMGVGDPGVIEVFVNVVASGQPLHAALEIRSAQ